MYIKCGLKGCDVRFRKVGNLTYHSKEHARKAQNARNNANRKTKKCFSCGRPCHNYQCSKCFKEKKGMRLTTRIRTRERKLELKSVEQWEQKLK